MFVCWQAGACLCVPTANEKMLPAKWVKRNAADGVVLGPVDRGLMNKLRVLKPGSVPHPASWSLFCGEGLPSEVATAFGRRRLQFSRSRTCTARPS